MSGVPVSVALVAGALAAFNPCGMPLLWAFLADTVARGATRLTMPRRVLAALRAGVLVAAGFTVVFATVGLPVSLGVAAASDAVPWVGVGFGVTLLLVGLVELGGTHVELPARVRRLLGVRTRTDTPILFGLGYGIASLGCTLPVVLAVVGAGSAEVRPTATLMVFATWGAGLAVVVVTLALAATLIGRTAKRPAMRVQPHLRRLTAAVLVIAGGYLTYYWVRVGFGDAATATSDPLVSAVVDVASWIEARAQSGVGAPLLVAAALGLAAVAIVSRLRQRKEEPVVSETPRPQPKRARLRGSPVIVAAIAIAGVVVGALAGYDLGASRSSSAEPDGPAPRAAAAVNPPDLAARAATADEVAELRSGGRAAGIADFTGVDDLAQAFDESAGATRVIALLSPTCITCLRGAQWIQDILEDHPDANVQVYAIWFSLLPSDGRAEWEDGILTDERVVHLWDDRQVMGRLFADLGYGDLPVQWDAVFVYGPEARWGAADEPSDLVIWRRPIIGYASELEDGLRPLLDS